MADAARVTSIDALSSFKAAMVEFGETSTMALSEAVADAQRTIWWIQHDRLAHWQREAKRRLDKLNQAKAELFKKQLESNDTRTSAVVERKNAAKAQAAVDEAETKIRSIRKWSMALERDFMLFKAGLSQISTAVAGDVPVAIARVERMMNSLEAYLRVVPEQAAIASAEPREAASEDVLRASATAVRADAEGSTATHAPVPDTRDARTGTAP